MAVPIWRDKYVNLGTTDGIEYRISDDNGVIFYGKAYKRPGATYVETRLNDVCRNRLSSYFPLFDDPADGEVVTDNCPMSFVTEAKVNNTWVQKDSSGFIIDWTYDYDTSITPVCRSLPINGKVRKGNYLLVSAHLPGGVGNFVVTYVMNDGTTSTQTYPGPFADGVIFTIHLATSDYRSITINGVTYTMVESCGRYTLHYLNALGGWDSFLLEGNCTERDELTRHTKDIDYFNTQTIRGGRKDYMIEQRHIYTFNTHAMVDAETVNMSQLLNSPRVYLYDAVTHNTFPVVITDTATEYKTYKGNGNKLSQYTITAELAQERIRM